MNPCNQIQKIQTKPKMQKTRNNWTQLDSTWLALSARTTIRFCQESMRSRLVESVMCHCRYIILLMSSNGRRKMQGVTSIVPVALIVITSANHMSHYCTNIHSSANCVRPTCLLNLD